MSKPIAATIMAGLVIIAAAGLVASSAAAQPVCEAWEVAKVQREEGKAWTASVCAPRKGRDSYLEIVCFGKQINVRHIPALPEDKDLASTNWSFTLATSTASKRLQMTYEGMDGAFTAYLAPRNPVLEMMMSGDELTIQESRGRIPSTSYTLRGSRSAISTLLARCGT